MAQAQSAPPEGLVKQGTSAPAVTLAVAAEAAWLRAVQARETEGLRMRAQAGRAATASAWAAPPVIEMNHRDGRGLGNNGGRESGMAVVWALWLPGQRNARGAVVDAASAQADAAERAGRLRVAGEVREAAWQIVARHAALAQADTQEKSMRQIAADVDRRVRAGELARADALAARAELLSTVSRQAELRQQLKAAQSRWSILVGSTQQQTVLDSSVLDETPRLAGAINVLHPEMELAALSSELARKRLEAQRLSRRDAPELTLGVRHEGAGRTDPALNSLVVGLRLPLSTADRNLPLLAAAQSEWDIAQTSEQRVRERLEATATAARHAVQAAEQQLAVERERATLLRERANLTERAFRAGEFALPELLRALSAVAQADTAVAIQAAELGLARAQLLQSLGVMP